MKVQPLRRVKVPADVTDTDLLTFANYALAKRFVLTRDREDATIKAIGKMREAMAKWRPDGGMSLSSYLIQSAMNAVSHLGQHLSHRGKLVFYSDMPLSIAELCDISTENAPDPSPDPCRQMQESELWEAFEKFFKPRLTHDEWDYFQARVMGDRSRRKLDDSDCRYFLEHVIPGLVHELRTGWHYHRDTAMRRALKAVRRRPGSPRTHF